MEKEYSIPPHTLCYHRLKTISDVVNDSNAADISLKLEKGNDIAGFYRAIKNGLELKYGKPVSDKSDDAFRDEVATIHFKYDSSEKDSCFVSIVLDKDIKIRGLKILADCIRGINEILTESARHYGIKLVCDELELTAYSR